MLSPRTAPIWSLALVAALAGCGSTPGDDASGTDAGPDDTSGDVVVTDIGSDVADDTSADGGTCEGFGPECSFGCGGDAFVQGDCVDGEWVCPEGSLPRDECPPDSCFGLPEQGEVCVDGAWECRPWDRGGLPACGAPAEVLCMSCDGFEAPYETDGCSCTCDEGLVTCGAPFECESGTAMTDFGVAITIDLPQCVFTTTELAAGVDLGWTVTVDDDAAPLYSRPLDAGGCDGMDPSGLRTFARIVGDDQQWCICDEGLCMSPIEDLYDPSPGVWDGAITWDGRNWAGPSDTGNPPGDAFGPGEYRFTVRAAGRYLSPDGSEPEWDITVSAPIRVVAP